MLLERIAFLRKLNRKWPARVRNRRRRINAVDHRRILNRSDLLRMSANIAETATSQKAANTSKRKAERNARRTTIHQQNQIQLPNQPVNHHSRNPKKKPAVKNQPVALPD